MFAAFNRFEIQMTKQQASACSHPGPCDSDVKELLQDKKIVRQLKKISDADLSAELREYGAWDEEELKDREQNEARIIWLAAGDIVEGK